MQTSTWSPIPSVEPDRRTGSSKRGRCSRSAARRCRTQPVAVPAACRCKRRGGFAISRRLRPPPLRADRPGMSQHEAGPAEPGERAERRPARRTIGVYHEQQLLALLEHIRAGFAQLDASQIDAFELDEPIHRYKRSARELWKFCSQSGSGWLTAARTLEHLQEAADQERKLKPTSRRNRSESPRTASPPPLRRPGLTTGTSQSSRWRSRRDRIWRKPIVPSVEPRRLHSWQSDRACARGLAASLRPESGRRRGRNAATKAIIGPLVWPKDLGRPRSRRPADPLGRERHATGRQPYGRGPARSSRRSLMAMSR